MKKLIALLLVLALSLSVVGCSQNTSTTPGSTPGTTNPDGTVGSGAPTSPPKDPAELHELYKRGSYTGSDADVLAAHDTVVATLGDATLTNSMLHFYYWMGVYDFISNYGSYLSQTGLDINKSLDAQALTGTDGTWQHYFLDNALGSWRYYTAMAMECELTGTPISAEYQKNLENFYDELTKTATENGFSSIDAMIQSDMGIGCTAEDYYTYTEIGHKAHTYFTKLFYEISFTDEQIEAYFTENEAALAVDGITKTTGDSYLVRHILFQVAETKTDADWEECRQKAENLMNTWLAGDATEDSFAELAKEHSEDPGSQGAGGLYSGLTSQTSFVQEFKDWYLAAGRKPGDYGLIKTSYGYHIMYFSGTEPIWEFYCREALVDEESAKQVNAIVEKYELVVDYDKILLGEVKLTEEK